MDSKVWLGPKAHANRHHTSLMCIRDYVFSYMKCPRGRRLGSFVWRLTKLACLLIFMIITLTVGYLVSEYRTSQCLEDETIKILETLCREYQEGQLTGDLCSDICDENFKYEKCLNYRGGKVVIQAVWRYRHIILKSKKAFIQDYDPPGYVDPKSGHMDLPAVQDFYSMMADTVKYNLGVSPQMSGQDLVNKLWNININFEKYLAGTIDNVLNDGELALRREAAMVSIWSLLQQDEYLLMRYSKSLHIPDIFGTCGHFYAMEYIPPGRLLQPNIWQISGIGKKLAWEFRAHLALKLLDLLNAFDKDLIQPLHFCDMKGENFGRNQDGVVKTLDTDMAIYEGKIGEVLSSQSNCSTHADCDFFDCKGWCNLVTKKCTNTRTNNNLQSMCEKVFISNLRNGYQGLLKNIPSSIERELNLVLNTCVNPPMPPGLFNLPGCVPSEVKDSSQPHCDNPGGATTSFAADSSVFKELYRLLALSLAQKQV